MSSRAASSSPTPAHASLMVTDEDKARSLSQHSNGLRHLGKDGLRSQAALPLWGETGDGKGWGIQLSHPSAVQ